jgi:predicted MFS family arabinose efflux permease
MKRLSLSTPIRLLLLLIITAFMVTMALAQGDEAPSAMFPIILFVPYALGVLVHWAKKWKEDSVQNSFGSWFFTNIGLTIGTTIAGVASIWAIYSQVGNGGLYPVTLGSWLAVFYIGLGADSFNSSKK